MENQNKRPSRKVYFMNIAYIVAQRATCIRRSVGAVLVKEDKILATGYNGAPVGHRHCFDIGCLRKDLNIASGERHELCRGIHAEQNVIIQAATHGISIKNSVLFCTYYPCSICSKMIANAGISKIYYANEYSDSSSKDILEKSEIEVIHFSNPKILCFWGAVE